MCFVRFSKHYIRISTITNKIILIYIEMIEMSVQKQPSFLCEVSYLRVYVCFCVAAITEALWRGQQSGYAIPL